MRRPLLLPVAVLLLALLAGCTTYTWPDGHRETVWGVPAGKDGPPGEATQETDPATRSPADLPDE